MTRDRVENPGPTPTEAASAEAVGPWPDDAELLRRHRLGDRDAFARLVRRWEAPAFRIAFRVLGDRAEAEEVRQDVFLTLLRAPGSVRHPERFAGWLRASVVNRALSAARRSGRRRGMIERLGRLAPRPDVSGPDGEPAEALALLEDSRRLADAMAAFEPEDRALLALRFEEDLTFRAIAEATGRPVTTIKSRLAVLIHRLRSKLGGPTRHE
ncbi:sigma-70 family RNA polymerase sigma factor [Tautonia sp. JC769]|uniref:RNA polymerase sigma factor n=1 Tax=Tautonia sp. JC769 TaxID=3232135 RepID=UPI00345B42B9